MLFDPEKYRINISYIKHYLEDKSKEERYSSISMLAVVTGVPVLVICVYLIELYGDDMGIRALMVRLNEFYT